MTTCHFDNAIQNANDLNSNGKVPPLAQKGKVNMKVAGKQKKRVIAKIPMKIEICEGNVSIDLPLQTKSEANCFEPWQVKRGRHTQQQKTIAMVMNPIRDKIKLPCKIMLIRFAPNELDKFDNLPMSFKYIVDAICSIITKDYRPGHADSDKRISIACDQVKSKEYGIRIEITF